MTASLSLSFLSIPFSMFTSLSLAAYQLSQLPWSHTAPNKAGISESQFKIPRERTMTGPAWFESPAIDESAVASMSR